MSTYYDVAQICLNGHLITDRFNDHPEHRKMYCEKCGEPTINQCPKCNKEIRGEHIEEGWIKVEQGVFKTHFPYYCDSCGSPYPWTTLKLEAIKELAKEIKLPKNEKELLITSLPDLITDSPKTTIAVVRWRKGLAVAGDTVLSAIRDILVDIISESVKKSLFG
jgi:hypothetical protein